MTSSVDESRWIRRMGGRQAGGQCRLVCFPHAGGSASYYLPLARALAPGVEVLAVQYPGRQDRRAEPLLERLPDIADEVFATRSAWGHPPFAFFGHSMGAVVAFEVARRLARSGEQGPVRFFASGRRAPSRHRDDAVHLMSDAGMIAQLRRIGGTDPRLLADPELLAMILPATRSDYRAIETYVCAPAPPLDCPISVLVGDTDPTTTVEEAAAWRECTTAPCDVQVFSSGHFFLDSHWEQVAGSISAALRAL